jgi:acetyl-CoA carboxylase carboxyl transferase subunit alpha
VNGNVIIERERGLLEVERRIADLRSANVNQPVDFSAEIASLEQKYETLPTRAIRIADAVGKGQHGAASQPPDLARLHRQARSLRRAARRPRFPRRPGHRGGLCDLARARNVMAIGQQRGRDTKENLRRNFGMVTPEGYRKVQRLAHTASRLGLPIVTFVDTKGADPGIASEEHAQSEAIAICLQEFTQARVPIVASIIGEGGSGGALALGIADHVIMLEHIPFTRLHRRKAALRSCGAMPVKRKKPRRG